MFLDVFLWYWLFDRGFLAKLFGRKEAYVDDRTLPGSLFGLLRWPASPFSRATCGPGKPATPACGS